MRVLPDDLRAFRFFFAPLREIQNTTLRRESQERQNFWEDEDDSKEI